MGLRNFILYNCCMVFLNFICDFYNLFFFFSVGRSPSPLFYIQRLTFTPVETDTLHTVRELWEKQECTGKEKGVDFEVSFLQSFYPLYYQS